MMKITNVYNLPEPFVRAVSQKTYDNEGSWRTVTELIGPAKISALRRKHDDEIEADASDLVYTFQGEVSHALVERSAKEMQQDGWLSEVRIHHDVLGKHISGAFDLYNPETKELIDVKNSTVWKAASEDKRQDYVKQTNLLAHLIRTKMLDKNGKPMEVKSIKILLICRDHSVLKALSEYNYPKHPVMNIDVDVWPDEKVKQYLHDRVTLHLKAEQEPQSVECNPEERFAEPSKWVIKKIGGKKALPNHSYADEAKAYEVMAQLGKGHIVEHRPATNKRCIAYCNVNKWCQQFQNSLKKQ